MAATGHTAAHQRDRRDGGMHHDQSPWIGPRLIGPTPGLLRLPPCSPGSTPLRAASGGGLWPGLTLAARDGATSHGRDGETALDRTEKHGHASRVPRRVTFSLRQPVTELNRVYFGNRSFSSSGSRWSLTQRRSATA